MRAKVKGFEGLGRDEPATYVSPNPHDDAFSLRVLVGPAEGPGEESFDVLVCTPAWLARTVAEQGPMIGRHRLIVEHLDLPLAEQFLSDQIERLDEPSWPELAAKIARLGHWEFEDYRP
ncbi:MAG TPA: immunity 8 family protein [Acidimicrobiia bacterium]|nr:immunity 8 family protein [Acidimicrobiia bacterium]